MAVTFIQKKKRQKYLIIVLGALAVGIIFILLKGFLIKPGGLLTIVPDEALKSKEIKINFEILKSDRLKELQLFEATSEYEGEVGRENPFSPYETIEWPGEPGEPGESGESGEPGEPGESGESEEETEEETE